MNKLQMLKDLYNERDIDKWHVAIEHDWRKILAVVEIAIALQSWPPNGKVVESGEMIAWSILDKAIFDLVGDND